MSSPPARRPGVREALVAFRYRNFALFWTGAVLSNIGTWAQQVTIPYVVNEITGSKALLGLAGFAVTVPMFLMTPVGGTLADRFPRRRILVICQSALGVLALALAVAWVLGPPPLWVIVALGAAGGFVTGVFAPSWQAFVSELVPRDKLLNAVTLNSMQFNLATAFGPVFGGAILAVWGPAAAFGANAASYLIVLAALGAMRLPAFVPRPRHAGGFVSELRGAARYARGMPGIIACFLLVVALAGLGMPVSQFFVVFAKDVFVVGDTQYGMLAGALGIGSLVAAPLIAGRGSAMRRSRLVWLSFLAYGGALFLLAVSPGFVAALVVLLVAGGGYLGVASTLNTTIQLQVDEAMRGKVLALYLMCLSGAMPIGIALYGIVAQAAGIRVAVGGAAALLLAATAYLRFGTDLVHHMDDEGAPAPAPEPAHAEAFGSPAVVVEPALGMNEPD